MESIYAINGGAVVAMTGENCVAIASDKRFGFQSTTLNTDFSKIYKIHPHLYVGFPGLATDTITCYETIRYRANIYSLTEEKVISPKTYAALTSNFLYQHRFGPYFVEPIVAGLMPKTHEPYIAQMDVIGFMTCPKDFVISGSCSRQLFGMCEAVWRPNMDAETLFETVSQALVNSADRDAYTGWGAVVHIIEPKRVQTRHVKTRMD